MPASITIEINGEESAVPSPANIRQLLQYLGVRPERVAVELNHRIVKRKEWDDTPLDDRDKIEIVQFVGGG